MPLTERVFTGQGDVFAVATADLFVWDLTTGPPIGEITGGTGRVRVVTTAVLDGRPVIVSGSDNGVVQVWDLATGGPVGQPFTGHTGPVEAVAAGPDGRPFAISASEGSIRTWDLAARVEF